MVIMEIPTNLSPIIRKIADAELASDNMIKNIVIENNGIIGIDMSKPIRVHRIRKIWENYEEHLAGYSTDFPMLGWGYTDRKTKHYIQYIEKTEDQSAHQLISANLHPLLDMELKLGNKIRYIARWLWTGHPNCVVMKYPLHFQEAKNIMDHSKVKYSLWEPCLKDGGSQEYYCLKTYHSICSALGDN